MYFIYNICACVCGRERGREGERERKGEKTLGNRIIVCFNFLCFYPHKFFYMIYSEK